MSFKVGFVLVEYLILQFINLACYLAGRIHFWGVHPQTGTELSSVYLQLV